jgi:hypothetical protein
LVNRTSYYGLTIDLIHHYSKPSPVEGEGTREGLHTLYKEKSLCISLYERENDKRSKGDEKRRGEGISDG